MNRIKELRERKNLTRTELAVAIGVSERHIFFLESGKRLPSMKTAQRLSQALGKGMDDIFLSLKSTDSTINEITEAQQ